LRPIRFFRHQDWIQPGHVADYLDAHAIPWEVVAIDRGESIPQGLDDASALVFLGGTMSFGRKTFEQLKDYQLAQGLPATGAADPALVLRLATYPPV